MPINRIEIWKWIRIDIKAKGGLCGAHGYVAPRDENGLTTRFGCDERHITLWTTVNARTASRGDLLA